MSIEHAEDMRLIVQIGAAALVGYQIYLNTRQKKLELTFDILEKYRSIEFKKHERFVKRQLQENSEDIQRFLENTIEYDDSISANNSLIRVFYFFDYVGKLCISNGVIEEIILEDLGDDAEIIWVKFSTLVTLLREKRSYNFIHSTKWASHFEYLVNRNRFRRRRLGYALISKDKL